MQQSKLEQQITEERFRISQLDSVLDKGRTPYLKGQLRHAANMLDDANAGLGYGGRADVSFASMWFEFAELNLQMAVQIRSKVQATVDKYGGPKNVVEAGS